MPIKSTLFETMQFCLLNERSGCSVKHHFLKRDQMRLRSPHSVTFIPAVNHQANCDSITKTQCMSAAPTRRDSVIITAPAAPAIVPGKLHDDSACVLYEVQLTVSTLKDRLPQYWVEIADIYIYTGTFKIYCTYLNAAVF